MSGATTRFESPTEGAVGVLLNNLGTPHAPTPEAVRRYLHEFLSDPRVIRLPRWLWRPILHGLILRVRPARSARAYESIWDREGSPLLIHSKRQAAALQTVLDARSTVAVHVALGMRYGKPSLQRALEALRDSGAARLVVLPLYPQYSGTTTGSTRDAVAAALRDLRWPVAVHFVDQYHDDPGYIGALVNCVTEHWTHAGKAERIIFSFHGLPKRYCERGDPYAEQCEATARRLARALRCADGEWSLAFQSRVGFAEWLQPYTEELLAQWGRDRVGRVQVLCPGFAADCLETLEEIGMRARARFRACGGESLEYIPALNERPDHIDALAAIVLRALDSDPPPHLSTSMPS